MGYTNHDGIKGPILIQNLRAESDTWTTIDDTSFDPPTTGLVYDYFINSLTTEEQWGTLTFQYDHVFNSYQAIDFASYFTSICSVGETLWDCGQAYTNSIYYEGSGYSFQPELAPLSNR